MRTPAAVIYLCSTDDPTSQPLLIAWCEARAAAENMPVVGAVVECDDLLPAAERSGWQSVLELADAGAITAVVTAHRGMLDADARGWQRLSADLSEKGIAAAHPADPRRSAADKRGPTPRRRPGRRQGGAVKASQSGRVHRMPLDATAPTVDGRLEDVNAVRDEMRDTLGKWGLAEPDVDDVLLVASELVANAARHSPPGRHHLSLHLTQDGNRIGVTVHDLSKVMPRPALDAMTNDEVESGRGLILVAALAENWGAKETGSGKKVWANLKLQTPVMVPPPSRAAERARVIAEVVRTSRLYAVPHRATA